MNTNELISTLLAAWSDFYIWASDEPTFIQVAVGIGLVLVAVMAVYLVFLLCATIYYLLSWLLYRTWSPHLTAQGFALVTVVVAVLALGGWWLVHHFDKQEAVLEWFKWLLGITVDDPAVEPPTPASPPPSPE